jgi:uncharacterized membrane protein SpoIIM required for sporulation
MRRDVQAHHAAFDPGLRDSLLRVVAVEGVRMMLQGNRKRLASFLDLLKAVVGRRWPLMAFLFVVELVVVIYVANVPFFPTELSNYETQYNNLGPVINASATGQVTAIFANNFKVATVELIPALGLGVFGLSLYETARIIEVIGMVKGVGTGFALVNLFALPSTWLELPAYAIAATESIYLAYAIYLGLRRGWGRFAKEIPYLFVNVILIAGVLLVAAVFEVSEIQIAGSSAEGPFYAFFTWLPFAFVLAGAIVFWTRAKRDAPALEGSGPPGTAPDADSPPAVGGGDLPQYEREAGSPTSSPPETTAQLWPRQEAPQHDADQHHD